MAETIDAEPFDPHADRANGNGRRPKGGLTDEQIAMTLGGSALDQGVRCDVGERVLRAAARFGPEDLDAACDATIEGLAPRGDAADAHRAFWWGFANLVADLVISDLKPGRPKKKPKATRRS